jgi:WD40 repeat protein/serine/threonine protein kinase
MPLGDYRIVREVGRGGMGVVYEAEQLSLGRRVALKVLPFAAALDPRHLQRFKNEAQAAAHLHHTNIVPVHAVGCERGVHFYAMQFIEGRTVAALIEELRKAPRPESASRAEGLTSARPGPADATGPYAPLPPAPVPDTPTQPVALSTERSAVGPAFFRSVAGLGLQAAAALDYAHRQGVIHRDIKPSNLLVDGQGTLWVADFGLAHILGDAGLTLTGDLVGTLRYMSPEQTAGKQVLVDQRTDIYSLGVTLYEFLTLQPAFPGDDRQVLLRQILAEEPRPPRRLNRAVPAELETVVLKAMAKEPGDRYPTAGALAEDLRRFLDDRPILARRASLAERSWRWCRRNPALAVLTASVVLLLALVAAGSAVAGWLRHERNTALANQQRAEGAEAELHDQHEEVLKLLQRARDAEQEATAKSHLAEARAHRWSGRVGQRFKSLEELAAAARVRPTLELRNEAIACLALTDLRLARSWDGTPAGTTCLTFDAAFERYARSDGQGNISVRRVADDRELVSLTGPGSHAHLLRFSPDGQYLVAAYHERPGQLWRLSDGRPLREARGYDFSPDGRYLAGSTGDGWICLWDVASGKEEKHFASGPGGHNLAFDPAGGRLAAAHASRPLAVEVYDPDTGAVVLTLPHPSPTGPMSWRPDGRFLAVGCGEHIYVWDARTGKQQAVLRGHESLVEWVTFSHSGDLLASSGWDHTLRLWDPMTGRQLLSQDGGGWPQFGPGDRLLGFTMTGPKVELWEVAGGGAACGVLCGPRGGGGVWSVDFSPDGRLLASTDRGGIRLWDCTALREVASVPRGGIHSAVFQPADGSLLTCGEGGLYRWPVSPEPGSAGAGLRLGLPQLVGKAADIWQACPAPGGRMLAVADRTNARALVLDLEGPGDPIVLPGNPDIGHVALSPDGRWLASGSLASSGPAVRVWDVPGRKLVWELPADLAQGSADVAFSPDGRWLVTGGPREYRFWHAGTWQASHILPRDHAGTLGAMAFTRDGKLLAVAHSSRVVRLLDAGTGLELASLAALDPQRIFRLCFSPDGGRLAACCDNQVIQVWDLRHLRRELAARGLDWDLLAYPPPGEARGPGPLRVRVWTGELRRFEGHTGAVQCVAYAPDGKHVLSGGWDNTLRLWDVATGKEVMCFKGHSGWVMSVAFSPKGDQALSASTDGTVRLWDVQTGKELKRLVDHTGDVTSVAFAPDGRHALSGGADRDLRLWDLETGRVVRPFVGHSTHVRCVAFSPKGDLALSGAWGPDATVRLWDVQTGKEVRLLGEHAGVVVQVGFSTDGRFAVSAGWDRTVRVWDVAARKEVHCLRGHTEGAESAAFSPDGRHVLSAGRDGTVRLWEVATEREVRRFGDRAGVFAAVAFAPDGRTAVSANPDLTLSLWELPPEVPKPPRK